MGRKISLIVNYENDLHLWHIAVEQIILTQKNDFIKPADFASWIGERYLCRGCHHVICIEWLNSKTTKSALKNLAECDASFITDSIRKNLGERWEFLRNEISEVKN